MMGNMNMEPNNNFHMSNKRFFVNEEETKTNHNSAGRMSISYNKNLNAKNISPFLPNESVNFRRGSTNVPVVSNNPFACLQEKEVLNKPKSKRDHLDDAQNRINLENVTKIY